MKQVLGRLARVGLLGLVALEAVEEGGLFRRVWDSIRLFFYSLFN